MNKGGCSDTCNNTEGSFSCSCPTGKILGADEKTCICKAYFNNKILPWKIYLKNFIIVLWNSKFDSLPVWLLWSQLCTEMHVC